MLASTASSRSWTRRLVRKRRRSGARSMSSVLAPSTSAMPSRGSRYLLGLGLGLGLESGFGLGLGFRLRLRVGLGLRGAGTRAAARS